MDQLPCSLAVAACTLAALNPCGFALLPVYLTVLVAGDDEPSWAAASARAVVSTAAMVTGFALFGLGLTPVAGQVQARLPWFTIVFGLALIELGAWLITGRLLPRGRMVGGPRAGPDSHRAAGGRPRRRLRSRLPRLLHRAIPGDRGVQLPGRLAGAGLLLFLGYAGMIVGTAALALALARTSVIDRMRRLAPLISPAGGRWSLLPAPTRPTTAGTNCSCCAPTDLVVGAALAVQGRLSDAITTLCVPAVGSSSSCSCSWPPPRPHGPRSTDGRGSHNSHHPT